MMLESYEIGGDRQQRLQHCREHRPLTYYGRDANGDLMFEAHAPDRRTYVIRMAPDDMGMLVDAFYTDGERQRCMD